MTAWTLETSTANGVIAIDSLVDADMSTFEYLPQDLFPWLQIDMKASQLVKAVSMKGES